MSKIASWSYKNIATVWPLQPVGTGWGGSQNTYGTPYQIACTWVGGGQLMRNHNGKEFAPSYRYYHEDARVKYGDWIARGGESDRLKGEPIQAHTEYDMLAFGDITDYMSVT